MNSWTVTLSVDGRVIRKLNRFRGQSGPFVDFQPLDNIFGLAGPILNRAIDEGWYVMLKPLLVGEHVLHFTADDSFGFTLEVTYNITVVAI